MLYLYTRLLGLQVFLGSGLSNSTVEFGPKCELLLYWKFWQPPSASRNSSPAVTRPFLANYARMANFGAYVMLHNGSHSSFGLNSTVVCGNLEPNRLGQAYCTSTVFLGGKTTKLDHFICCLALRAGGRNTSHSSNNAQLQRRALLTILMPSSCRRAKVK